MRYAHFYLLKVRMNIRSSLWCVSVLVLLCTSGCNSKANNDEITTVSKKKVNLFIILGTTRQGRTSDKLATVLQRMLSNRTDINTELIDLREYQLPLLDEAVVPSRRKTITDPAIQKWSDKIKQADAFIWVVPEYNRGYPAVFKNALDILYSEWNGKTVGLVGYSGGPSGGKFALSSLGPVMDELKMKPVESMISIPTVWKAFDDQGNLFDTTIEGTVHTMVDQIVAQVAVQ